MAAFALSYYGLTKENIRHIYSDRKSHIFVPSPRPFKKSTQFLDVPLVQRFPPRFYDYYPTFNVGLPRAPAFNHMSFSEIRQVVERMSKPIECQKMWLEGQCQSERSKRRKVVRFHSPVHDDGAGGYGTDKTVENCSGKCQGQDKNKTTEDSNILKAESSVYSSSANAEESKTEDQKSGDLSKTKVKDTSDPKVKAEKANKLPEVKPFKKREDGKDAKNKETSADTDTTKVKDGGQDKAKDGGQDKIKDSEDEAEKKDLPELSRKRKRLSKREKVKESFSKLTLLPPINKGQGKTQQQAVLQQI